MKRKVAKDSPAKVLTAEGWLRRTKSIVFQEVIAPMLEKAPKTRGRKKK